MRLINLIRGDIHFQIKYGFYFVYFVFTCFYICLLYAFPASIREKALSIMIFSDPAAMGLFFMGAIVLLEKSQRVINSIAVSPVKITEYINAKIVSLGIISTAVGVILAVSAGEKHFIRVILGTFLGSVIFSLLGLIVATRITSLNQFMVATIPFELICIVPPVVYLLGYKKELMLIHPGCIVIQLITGEAGMNPTWFLLLFIWIVIIYDCAYRSVKSMFREVGGVKL